MALAGYDAVAVGDQDLYYSVFMAEAKSEVAFLVQIKSQRRNAGGSG